MKTIVFVSIFVAYLSCTTAAYSKHKKSKLTNLDGGNTNSLDKYVRQKLLFKIVAKLNDTVRRQNTLALKCEEKLNTTLTSCSQCNIGVCHSSIILNTNSIYNHLIPFIYKPVLLVGGFVHLIKDGLASLIDLLGNTKGLFYRQLGFLAKDVGESLARAAVNVLQGASQGLLLIGNGLENTASTLLHGTGNAVAQLGQGAGNLLTGLGTGTNDLLSQISHSAQSVGNGLGNLGSGLVNGLSNLASGAVNTLGNVFSGLLGKRDTGNHPHVTRSCVTQCPVCSTIDLNLHSQQEIIKMVCGKDVLLSQGKAEAEIQMLKSLYQSVVNNTIIKSVDYNTASINTTGGVSFGTYYSTVLISANGDGQQLKGPLALYMTDLPKTADSLAAAIFQQWENIDSHSIVV